MQYGSGNYCKECNQRFYISGYQGSGLDQHVKYCPFCGRILIAFDISSEEEHRKFVYSNIAHLGDRIAKIENKLGMHEK